MSNVKIKILAVYDNSENLGLMEEMPDRLGAEIFRAGNVEEAIELMAEHDFAFIVVDICESEDNRLAIAESIRKPHKGSSLPIIFVTEPLREGDRYMFESFDSGPVDYIYKPLNTELFISKAKMLISLYEAVRADRKYADVLQRYENMESVAMIAGVFAHDFNNMLTVMRGNIELAQMLVPDEEKAVNVLERAKGAADHAHELVREFVFLIGKRSLKKELFEIKDLVIPPVESVFGGGNITLEFSITENLPQVSVDGDQIKRIFFNLALNAKDAMEGSGTFTVMVEETTEDERIQRNLSDGRYVKISLQDSGPGISRENMLKIFDTNFTTKDHVVGKGYGLGLPVSHAVIKKHRGDLVIKSGKGTICHIFLPAAR